MSIETTTTLNPPEITIGSQVLYVCPWTGFDTKGEVVQENDEWGEGFFDIRPIEHQSRYSIGTETIDQSDYLDTAIHFTDIRPTDSE